MWKKMYERLCPCFSNTKMDSNNSVAAVYVNEAFQQEIPGVMISLGNTLILSKVFDYLSTLDLFSCRLVNHQWKQEASKIIRRKTEPIWLDSEEILFFTKMMKNVDNPYSRFALNLLDTKTSTIVRTDCRAFLEFTKVTMLIVHIFEEDVPYFVSHLKYVPTLETILFIIAKDNSNYRKKVELEGKMSKFKNELKLPQLKEVRFSIMGESRIDECIVEILNSSNVKMIDFRKWYSSNMENIFRYANFEHTHQLILNTMTNSQLTILSSKLMNSLNYLEMDMLEDVEDATLFEIFKKTSTTLETLQVSHKGQFSAFYIPNLMQLKSIVLRGWDGPILLDSVVLNCPHLEKLDIENFNPDHIVVHTTQSTNLLKHNGLKRLGLLYEGNFPKRKIKGVLKRLLPKFPNVKDFYSAAETDDMLELILSSVSREMDSIFLDFSMEVSDGSFTGIPLEILEASHEDETERLECGCWVLNNPKLHRKSAYIGDLKKLQQLHISMERGSQMSNLSIHHGITDLKSLKILRLYAKGIHFCLKAIADNLPNLQRLYLKSQELYSNSELDYIMERISGLVIEFSTDSGYGHALVHREL